MTYSYTQISQYLSCPRRYKHRYLAKLTDPLGNLETIIRYQRAIRRDRDNAADRLLKLQRARGKLKREHRH